MEEKKVYQMKFDANYVKRREKRNRKKRTSIFIETIFLFPGPLCENLK